LCAPRVKPRTSEATAGTRQRFVNGKEDDLAFYYEPLKSEA